MYYRWFFKKHMLGCYWLWYEDYEWWRFSTFRIHTESPSHSTKTTADDQIHFSMPKAKEEWWGLVTLGTISLTQQRSTAGALTILKPNALRTLGLDCDICYGCCCRCWYSRPCCHCWCGGVCITYMSYRTYGGIEKIEFIHQLQTSTYCNRLHPPPIQNAR